MGERVLSFVSILYSINHWNIILWLKKIGNVMETFSHLFVVEEESSQNT
jgi:hypothetical protein